MRITIEIGDITVLRVDAIVNAANETLLGGGGVDGAIHGAAGPGLLAECRNAPEIRPRVRCPTGEARITGGHRLHARYVIHTVGPVWHGGNAGEAELLAHCYRASLRLAADKHLASIAFPAISCGIYGYPPQRAVLVAVNAVRAWQAIREHPQHVVFCCFDAAMAGYYRSALAA